MKKIEVVNIKCGGCVAGIKSVLTKKGLKNVEIDPSYQLVQFEGDEKIAEAILFKMGYPRANTKEAESLLRKAKSFASCVIGKTKKNG